MARKRKRKRGNGAEQTTNQLLAETLRTQARLLAILEQGKRRRSPSRWAAGSEPRAVLTPRVQAEQKRVQPFPPPLPQYLMPAQYLQPPPPPPLPEPEDFGQVDEPITAADARLVRIFAETIRAMGQEHACV